MITQSEVKIFSQLSDDFPVNRISNAMIQAAVNELRECFGDDFMDTLEGDQVVDSNIYTEYVQGKTYAIGSSVIWNGLRYTSTDAILSTDVPGVSAKWGQFELFNTPEYQTLWTSWLRPYLANKISLPAITFGTYQVKGNGLMAHNDNNTGTYTVTPGQFNVWKAEVQMLIDSIFKMMKTHIKTVHDSFDDADDSPFKEVSFVGYVSGVCGDGTDCGEPVSHKFIW